ncbi:MAG: serine hydrolase domain-containing protein [Syntrophales bacterium]
MRTQLFLTVCRVLFACAILAGCGGTSQSGDPYSAAIAEGRAAVQEVMAETGAAAVSVTLVDGDRVIWSEAFGDADRGARRRATTDTLYGICSVSKMLATTAVMILVDQGLVLLDEPLTTYVKDFVMPLDSRYRDVTVRMLLNHSSGLPGNDLRGAITLAPVPGYAAQMMDSLKYQRLKHDPGLISAYNNDGFTMAENLVKAVTGREYPAFVRDNIFAPLGMNASRYQTEPLPENSYAAPYDETTRLAMFNFNVYGSGGLFSTPEDLARLGVMFINNGVYGARRILSARSVAAMGQDQRLGSFNPVPYEENRFGLGWDTVAQPGLAAAGVTVWDKTGDMSGYYGTNIAVAPEERLAVVVFGASGSFATPFSSAHAVTVSERILLRALVARGRLAAMPEPLPATPLPLKAVTAEEKSTFPGFYASSKGVYHLSYGPDDSLSVKAFGGDWTPEYENFKLRSDGWYAADNDPVKALRLLTRSGRAYIAQRLKRGYGHYSVTVMLAQRLGDKPALSAAWQARLDERWLPVNKETYVNFPVKVEDPSFRFQRITGLDGYLWGNNILSDMIPPSDGRLDGMFLTLPDGIATLVDAGIETGEGQPWLRLGSYLYRPLSGVPLLDAGPSTVAIGSDGFAQWRRLPAAGTLSLSGAAYWFLYDADFRELASGRESGAPLFSGSGAKYLLLYGIRGTAISLNLTASSRGE